jgi:hypothetical protein
MPNSTQTFNINSQGSVTPTGNSAQMSISGANNQANQAEWKAASAAATVKLPVSVWNVTANEGSNYSFTVAANSTSATFALLATAPQGTQSYVVDTGPGLKGGETRPTVIVNP